MIYKKRCNFNILKDKILKQIIINKEKNIIIFMCNDGTQYCQYHVQDCCENVEIEDVCGDTSDLIGYPILLAEEIENKCTIERENRDTEEKRKEINVNGKYFEYCGYEKEIKYYLYGDIPENCTMEYMGEKKV